MTYNIDEIEDFDSEVAADDVPCDSNDAPYGCDDVMERLDDELDEDENHQLYEHFRFEADPGQQPMRVDKFMCEKLQHSSRNRIQKAADAGFIHVNDRPVKSNYKVRPGDVVTLMLDRPRLDVRLMCYTLTFYPSHILSSTQQDWGNALRNALFPDALRHRKEQFAHGIERMEDRELDKFLHLEFPPLHD